MVLNGHGSAVHDGPRIHVGVLPACDRYCPELAHWSCHIRTCAAGRTLASCWPGTRETERLHERRLPLPPTPGYRPRPIPLPRPSVHRPVEQDIVGHPGGHRHAGVGHEPSGGGSRIGEFIEEGELGDAEGCNDLLLGCGVDYEPDHAVDVLGFKARVVYGFHGGCR